jgi:succinyl-CoA synthetase beta subunit
MKIHEYQAKELFRAYRVPTSHGRVALSPDEVSAAVDAIESGVFVVKAQIHAGGRGKGGGVKITKSREEAKALARNMFGMQLVTHQTGSEGQQVRRVYIEGGADIAHEFYLGLVLDRETSTVAVMASAEGGMDIEEVAAHHPEKIFKEYAHPGIGLQAFQARRLAISLGLGGKSIGYFSSMLLSLYRLFVEKDCSLVEVNPLVLQSDGALIALDGKINFDENALERHPDVVAMRDLDEEDPREIEASKFGLSYIKLDGDIGCLVNGAGLAMATMDIVKQVGCEPANFLDVGGGATTEKVTAAFRIILGDEVKAIFVNIFGGIMKCDTIAMGIVAAAKEVGIHVPVVARLEGTNVELGKKILAESGLNIISASSMLDGAEKVAAVVRGNA